MSLAMSSDEKGMARRILGDRLREARKYLGLNQEEVATTIGVPRTALSDIESGQRRVEALELSRLAQLYQRSVSYFTGDEVDIEFPPQVAHLARQAAELSENDLEELGRFAEFLRSRAQPEET